MVVVMLLLIVGGISLAQAVSDPRQVTTRWLRLGGIVAVALLGVAATVATLAPSGDTHFLLAFFVVLLPLLVQLMTVQIGRLTIQRISAAVAFVGLCWVVAGVMSASIGLQDVSFALHTAKSLSWWVSIGMTATSAGLMGGFLMTMLLGHAYLTAGNEMTQSPFRRLVLVMALLLVLRLLISGCFGIRPWMALPADDGLVAVWTGVMIAARYGVGIVVPGIFAYMIYDCVNRRANQSATGILYVATVLVILGEGMGFALTGSTGYAF